MEARVLHGPYSQWRDGGKNVSVCLGWNSDNRNGVAVKLKSNNNNKNLNRGKRLEDDIRNGHSC
jgi:hypothetical protein